MNPNQFKFIQEFPQYRDILNGSSFKDYKNRLAALKKKITEQEYKYVSGFSFEFVIGGLLHFYGGMPEFGVLDDQPTYVGSVDNPDHGPQTGSQLNFSYLPRGPRSPLICNILISMVILWGPSWEPLEPPISWRCLIIFSTWRPARCTPPRRPVYCPR